MKTLEKEKIKSGHAVWNLADAKNKFSEVVNLALHDGPQTVSRRGEKVVIVSEKTFKKLSGVEHSFLDFLFQKAGLEEVKLERNKSTIRKVAL